MQRRIKGLCHASLGALLAAHAAGAFAQDAAPAASATNNEGVTDIVVTADKRPSTAQKTAIAMTVYDQKQLSALGVRTLEDLSTIAPGVELGKNSANTIITIRGVSSQNTNEIGDPAVSIAQDGLYIQKAYGFADSLYDLERVEVLRGPQGTLYGRNATGGAINAITAKPVDHFEARTSVEVGNFDTINTEGMINIPVSGTVAVRASFSTRNHDGYRKDEAPAKAGDDGDTKSARIHVQWKPTSRLTLLATGQLTKIAGIGPTMTGFPLHFTATGAIDTSYHPDVPIYGVAHGLPDQMIDTTIRTGQLNADYDLGFAKLVYLGGFRNTDYHQLRDLDGTTNSSTYYNVNENVNDWSHEARLVSNTNSRLKWQVGGYYFHETDKVDTLFQSYAVANAPVNRFIFNYHVLTRSEAVFGQASYEIFDGISVEGGLRYSHDYKKRTGFSNTGAGNNYVDDASTSSKLTYHAALNWQATPRNLLYVKYDTGYKAGGFNSVAGGNTLAYGPETIGAVEVGSKNRFFDNKLQVNISGFHYSYKNQQVSVRDQTIGLSAVFNAGKSEIYGGELEAIFQPSSEDRLDASLDYLHAEYKQLCINKSTTGACLTSYAGNTPPQAPKWQIGAGYEHSFPLLGGTLTPRIQTHFESHSYLGIENFGYERQGRYTRSDALLTFTPGSEKWSLQGYVRNLENNTILTSAVASSLFASYSYGLQAPRTFGARLTYNF